MAEPGTRFAHLLQPIKDLSKVWKIDVAEELERYIDEVSQLLVTSPEDGVAKLNFAEAALLIQGSTAVYSRKVELLYQLVYQALDILAVKKEGAPGKKAGRQNQPSGLWAPIPETDELLTVDHLIKEGRNTLLDPNTAPTQRQTMQRRVPLFLMPRDQTDRRQREFRISSCTVHQTGVYLLQESDAKLLDELLDSDAAGGVPSGLGGDADVGPLVPPPPREVQDLDERLQELLRGCAEPEPVEAAGVELNGTGSTDLVVAPTSPPMVDGADAQPAEGACASVAEQPVVRKPVEGPDPWLLLDEHEVVGKDNPLKVGRAIKRIDGRKHLFAGAEGLPDGAPCIPSDAMLWDDCLTGTTTCSASKALPILAAGHPVESLFLAAAGRLKSGCRCETDKAGFSGAWLEFEDLFIASAAARKRRPRRPVSAEESPGAPPLEAPASPEPEDLGAIVAEDGCEAPEAQTPERNGSSNQLLNALELTEEKMRQEQRAEVVALENQILEAQQKYESTIRQHLQLIHKDGADTDAGKFPELYANVQRWQEQLAPVLKECEARPEFDIDVHSTKILSDLCDLREGECEDTRDFLQAVPFERLASGQPRWEVCRRFLTCLLLTNHGNIDIEYDDEQERLNGFRIRVLKADKRQLDPIGDKTEDRVPQPAPLGPAPLPPPAEGEAARSRGRPLKVAKRSPGDVTSAVSRHSRARCGIGAGADGGSRRRKTRSMH